MLRPYKTFSEKVTKPSGLMAELRMQLQNLGVWGGLRHFIGWYLVMDFAFSQDRMLPLEDPRTLMSFRVLGNLSEALGKWVLALCLRHLFTEQIRVLSSNPDCATSYFLALGGGFSPVSR